MTIELMKKKNRLRYSRKSRVKFRNNVLSELCKAVELTDYEFYGLISFPVYGKKGVNLLEKIRRYALLWFGDCGVMSYMKAFYRIVDTYNENMISLNTGSVDFVQTKKGKEIEKTWEIAR